MRVDSGLPAVVYSWRLFVLNKQRKKPMISTANLPPMTIKLLYKTHETSQYFFQMAGISFPYRSDEP